METAITRDVWVAPLYSGAGNGTREHPWNVGTPEQRAEVFGRFSGQPVHWHFQGDIPWDINAVELVEGSRVTFHDSRIWIPDTRILQPNSDAHIFVNALDCPGNILIDGVGRIEMDANALISNGQPTSIQLAFANLSGSYLTVSGQFQFYGGYSLEPREGYVLSMQPHVVSGVAQSGTHYLIEGCSFESPQGNYLSCIIVERRLGYSPAPDIHNVAIRNNFFKDCHSFVCIGGGGGGVWENNFGESVQCFIRSEGCKDLAIRNNTAIGIHYTGIDVQPSHPTRNLRLENNFMRIRDDNPDGRPTGYCAAYRVNAGPDDGLKSIRIEGNIAELEVTGNTPEPNIRGLALKQEEMGIGYRIINNVIEEGLVVEEAPPDAYILGNRDKTNGLITNLPDYTPA
jgi:hypothetical protein